MPEKKINVGIIGATGYTGAELVRILSYHPNARLAGLTTQSYAGMPFWEVYPHLYKHVDLVGENLDLEALVDRCDVIFTALPHGHSMDVAAEVNRKGKKLVDLGADFRFNDVSTYEKWYQMTHSQPQLNAKAVYGLPEIHREEIRKTDLVANPGCYPTSVILGLAPLLKNNMIDTNSIIIDSKSGVSGAGRNPTRNNHYCEANESIKAYNLAKHRHTPEIEQELSLLAGKELLVSFSPHLTPMIRGILSTIYAGLKVDTNLNDLNSLYNEFYAGSPFVRVLPPGMLPATKSVSGSNHCDIGMVIDDRTGRVIIVSAIDNLIKGASGQAVQNMNIMFGLPEETGLGMPGMFP